MTNSRSGDAGRAAVSVEPVTARGSERPTGTGADLDGEDPDSPTELTQTVTVRGAQADPHGVQRRRLNDLAAALTYYAVCRSCGPHRLDLHLALLGADTTHPR